MILWAILYQGDNLTDEATSVIASTVATALVSPFSHRINEVEYDAESVNFGKLGSSRSSFVQQAGLGPMLISQLCIAIAETSAYLT